MVDSGGLSIPYMVSSIIIFTTSDRNHRSLYPLMPLWPFSLQRDVSIELVSTRDRDFSGSLPVDMRGNRGWIPSPVFCVQQQIIFIKHFRHGQISREITNVSGVAVMPKQHPTNIKPSFRMLALSVWRGRVHHKTFESCLPSNSYFENVRINTHSKQYKKLSWKFFK